MSSEVIYIALCIAFLWGLTPVIHKHVLNTVDKKVVMVLSGMFYFTALIIYAAINWNTIKTESKKLTVPSVFWIGFVALVAGFFANLIYYYILNKHDSYVVSALIYSCPVFTLILAYLFLKEKISMYGLAGVLLIVLGVICLAMNERK
jgi:drug/metabolite transporter (DMT)-like permease